MLNKQTNKKTNLGNLKSLWNSYAHSQHLRKKKDTTKKENGFQSFTIV